MAWDSVAEANPVYHIEPATPAMTDDTTLPFSFPAVRGKKLTAAFDSGRLSSDGGVMLLAEGGATDGDRREACGRDPRSA